MIRYARAQLGSIRRVYLRPKAPAPASGDSQVVLLGGFFQPPSALGTLQASLAQRHGVRVARFTGLGPYSVRPVAHLIDELDAQVEGPTVLIGHSLGGLVSRVFAQGVGADRVRGIITLGTPHRGTPTALIGVLMGFGLMRSSIYELLPYSRLVRSLPPPAVPLVSVYSRADVVCPHWCSRLPEGQGANLELRGIGHTELLSHPRVSALLHAQLEDWA